MDLMYAGIDKSTNYTLYKQYWKQLCDTRTEANSIKYSPGTLLRMEDESIPNTRALIKTKKAERETLKCDTTEPVDDF